ncbi:MAG: M13 family metallopeptidase [Alphaproteobacteria bacterium]|nr:M13 family metallopeptidase [Alphaproteobacteria bacterium]
MHDRLRLVGLLALVACGAKAPVSPAPEQAATPENAPSAIDAAITAAIDPSVSPCDDFYQYACGGWIANTPLPPDRPIVGRGFTSISDRNQEIVRDILEHAEGADARLGSYYQTCVNTDAVEAKGTASLQADLDRIAALKDVAAIPALMVSLPMINPFFGGFVEADFKNPEVNQFQLAQGGIGLPSRDYYFPEDDAGRELLAAYEAHVGRMLGLAGLDPAGAAKVLAIETALAKASKSPAELRDIEAMYHPMTKAELKRLAPGVPWDALFTALGIEVKAVNVTTPDFFPALGDLLKRSKIADLKVYLAWNLVNEAAPYLPKAFDDESFAFYGTRLSGQAEQQPRWKRCVGRTDRALGDLLGEAYVAQAFPGESKDKALKMVGDLQHAFEEGLPELAWMDAPTRTLAKAKLDAIVNKIGYPDTWESYEGLQVGDDIYANQMAVAHWGQDDALAKVGKPVDKTEWGMSVPTVNAYYNPLFNEIVFPAGILQPPFFSADFPTAMNYGAMGMVIGHEITHGFDDEGRKFGPSGKLEVWWDDAVSERFEQRAQCIADTYDAIEVHPGTKLNGELTLGENIADFGGVKLASRAYADWQAAGGSDFAAGGFEGSQLLFLAFAQSWCSKATPEVEDQRAKVDPHAPPKFRVNVPLSSTPAFWEAFSCAEGTPMHPASTCEVW